MLLNNKGRNEVVSPHNQNTHVLIENPSEHTDRSYRSHLSLARRQSSSWGRAEGGDTSCGSRMVETGDQGTMAIWQVKRNGLSSALSITASIVWFVWLLVN